MPVQAPSSRRVTRRALALSVVLIAAASGALATTPRGEIEAALTSSAQGWSTGDLAAFTRVYEESPDTTYLKSDDVVRGFKAIRDMYAARFAAAPGGLGRLTLELVDFRALRPGWAEVIGRFALHPKTGGAAGAHGVFTLVFHHTPAGWKIASDHTS